MEISITECGWGPVITGTRITIYDVLHYLEKGRNAAYISELLAVSREQVLCAIQYINDHKERVMKVHRQIEEDIARGNSPEIESKRSESGAKLRTALRGGSPLKA